MFEQPPGSLVKQLTPVLSEREHAGRQTSADTNLPLVRRNPGGENRGPEYEYPPYLQSEATNKYVGNLICCTGISDVCTARLDSGLSEVFFSFSSFLLLLYPFVVGGGFSIRVIRSV